MSEYFVRKPPERVYPYGTFPYSDNQISPEERDQALDLICEFLNIRIDRVFDRWGENPELKLERVEV